MGEAPKGAIPLEGSKVILDPDNLIFKVVLHDREFILRTQNPVERTKWVSGILHLIENMAIIKKDIVVVEEDLEKTRSRGATNKNWKIENMDKEVYQVQIHFIKDLQKSGHLGNPELELSKKCLQLKGISKHLSSIKKEILESRIHYGFLQKRHKAKIEYFQKRWFFLISSRPLTDFGYDNDDYILEERVLPSFLMFDTLYYFECENENDTSEAKGNYSLKYILFLKK
jgi:hypothetical protein